MRRSRALALRPVLVVALAACGCTLPPLRGRAEIGKDPYAVFVARTTDGFDLFAILPSGGAPIPLTFTVVDEHAPALGPDGGALAFLRDQRTGDSVRTTVWVMNLLSGAEREIALPRALGAKVERVAWSRDGRTLYLRTQRGTFSAAAPPSAPAPRLASGAELAVADSSFFVLVGQPVLGRADACGTALCLFDADGERSAIAENASAPIRWGRDSLAFFGRGGVVVRPVGPGRPRTLRWEPAPVEPREMTYFEGRTATR